MKSIRAPLVKPATVMALALVSASSWHSQAQGATTSQTLTPGPVSFSITNPAASVYDLTGSYQFDQEVSAAGGRTLQLGLVFAVEQDAAGRLRGSGVTNMLIGGESVAASYRVSGRVSGGGMSVVKGAKNVDLAHKYIDWILCEPLQRAQALYLVDSPTNRRVVVPAEIAPKLTYGDEVIRSLTFMDEEKVAALLPDWVKRWNAAMAR